MHSSSSQPVVDETGGQPWGWGFDAEKLQSILFPEGTLLQRKGDDVFCLRLVGGRCIAEAPSQEQAWNSGFTWAIAGIIEELSREDLSIYSVVRLARKDLLQGNLKVALARLLVDADKLRCFETPLNDLLKRCSLH